MLVVHDAAVRFPRFTLGPVQLRLAHGERVALLGRNGSGKSTLLALLAGHRHATDGHVRLADADDEDQPDNITADGMRLLLRQRVAYVGAGLQALPWYSVRQHFHFVRHIHQRWNHDRAMELARTLQLDPDAITGTLSRGNLVKLNLCTAWGQDADVLLLDEPTAGLDPVARTDMLQELQRFLANHPRACVVYATHLLDELAHVRPTRLLMLHKGTLHESSAPAADHVDVNTLTRIMQDGERLHGHTAPPLAHPPETH